METETTPQTPEPEEQTKRRFEMLFGLTIALFAAALAVNDLGAGKYGDDEIMGTNEKANAYQWYQSKSIKESLVEGQRDTLQSLVDAGAVNPSNIEGVKKQIAKLSEKKDRYKKEKAEILLGSAKVGKENWVQDVEGELGKVIGAKEWESTLSKLAAAGDQFDFATLFLQVCLVIGAIGLLLQESKLRWVFYGLMVGLGAVGTGFSVVAYSMAMA